MNKQRDTRKFVRSVLSSFCLFLMPILVQQASASIPVKMAVGPDSNYQLLIDVLGSAKKEIIINIYEFENDDIAKVVVSQIKKGVAVKILLEGAPFRGMSQEGKRIATLIQRSLQDAGNTGSRFYLMRDPVNPDGWKNRRFHFNHAKYVIIDRATTLVASENFSSTGHAKTGSIGNRGWDIAMKDPEVTKQLLQVFDRDSDPKEKDIIQLYPSNKKFRPIPAGISGPMSRRRVPTFPAKLGSADDIHLVTAPENAQESLVKIIDSARKSIEFEFMSFPSVWRRGKNEKQNPVLSALLKAATRGVNVHVLLNDETVFDKIDDKTPSDGNGSTIFGNKPRKKPNNLVTAELLETYAKCKGLKLAAKIVDVKSLQITYIHNKGIITDGVRTLVSSINGTQNSMESNREVAVLVDGPQVAQYYQNVFAMDWKLSPDTEINNPKCFNNSFAVATGGPDSLFGL